MPFERLDKARLLQGSVIFAALVWTGILYGLYQWASRAEQEHLFKLMALRAESVASHTQTLRSWIGGHGGVYVEMTPGEAPANLTGYVPEEEVRTPSGRMLTLLSSSAVLGKISKEFKGESGDHVRLTSKQPMNPANLPDPWEMTALESLEKGAKKVEAVVEQDRQRLFRLMYPMELQPRCLRCHAYLSASPTRVVGGLSVTVDKAPYDLQYSRVTHQLSLGYLGIWAVGVAGLGAFGVFGSNLLRRIEYASLHDGLTGLLNRREIEARLAAECERAARYQHPLAVMMLDIDHFKQVNDTLGHQAGDEVLRTVARTIRRTIRRTDVAGRYGGEEFLVVAPETSRDDAVSLAKRLNAAIKAEHQALHDGSAKALTASIGVALFAPGNASRDDLINAADVALYRAKEAGRDRVVVMGDD